MSERDDGKTQVEIHTDAHTNLRRALIITIDLNKGEMTPVEVAAILAGLSGSLMVFHNPDVKVDWRETMIANVDAGILDAAGGPSAGDAKH